MSNLRRISVEELKRRSDMPTREKLFTISLLEMYPQVELWEEDGELVFRGIDLTASGVRDG